MENFLLNTLADPIGILFIWGFCLLFIFLYGFGYLSMVSESSDTLMNIIGSIPIALFVAFIIFIGNFRNSNQKQIDEIAKINEFKSRYQSEIEEIESKEYEQEYEDWKQYQLWKEDNAFASETEEITNQNETTNNKSDY